MLYVYIRVDTCRGLRTALEHERPARQVPPSYVYIPIYIYIYISLLRIYTCIYISLLRIYTYIPPTYIYALYGAERIDTYTYVKIRISTYISHAQLFGGGDTGAALEEERQDRLSPPTTSSELFKMGCLAISSGPLSAGRANIRSWKP